MSTEFGSILQRAIENKSNDINSFTWRFQNGKDVKLHVYVAADTKHVKMTDLQNISIIIHFFDNNKEPELTPIKKEFVNLLSQPSISVADVDQFRHDLTNVLKSDTKLYSLMSQL